jgi:hypothetical protein
MKANIVMREQTFSIGRFETIKTGIVVKKV